jgi:hypothetical protein
MDPGLYDALESVCEELGEEMRGLAGDWEDVL